MDNTNKRGAITTHIYKTWCQYINVGLDQISVKVNINTEDIYIFTPVGACSLLFSSSAVGLFGAVYVSAAVCDMQPALYCQQPVHQSRACRWVQTRSRPWMRAHLPEPGKAHGQVVNKWKWKIATTCGARSSTCKRERWSGHDGCPMSLLLLIWSKKYQCHPTLPIHHHNRQTDVCR